MTNFEALALDGERARFEMWWIASERFHYSGLEKAVAWAAWQAALNFTPTE